MKERLKKIREDLGKTQKEMSALLSLGEVTWQNYERGVSKPKMALLEKLSQMGYSIRWIMFGDGTMHKDQVAESTEYSDFSDGRAMTSGDGVNVERIFRGILDEFQEIYSKQLSRLPKNFVEIRAFRKTMEIARLADNELTAFELINKAIKNEIVIARDTPPNVRFNELI